MNKRDPWQQQGAALIVALVFLVMLTLLGLAAMGTNRAQQRETYGVSEQVLAFQAAETGVIDGEAWIENQLVRPVANCGASCPEPTSIWDAAAPAPEISFLHLRSAAWWNARGRAYGHTYEPGQPVGVLANQVIEGVAQAPRHVIEQLGPDPTASLVPGAPVQTLWYYRVTARGTGVQADPPSIVQTVYAKGY